MQTIEVAGISAGLGAMHMVKQIRRVNEGIVDKLTDKLIARSLVKRGMYSGNTKITKDNVKDAMAGKLKRKPTDPKRIKAALSASNLPAFAIRK